MAEGADDLHGLVSKFLLNDGLHALEAGVVTPLPQGAGPLFPAAMVAAKRGRPAAEHAKALQEVFSRYGIDASLHATKDRDVCSYVTYVRGT